MSFKTTHAIVAAMLAAFLAGSTCLAKDDGREQPSKPKVKERKEENKEVRQGNFFTRFWIHTVGSPMARGMKDGMKKVHKGLGMGSGKVKDAFDCDEKTKETKKDNKKKSGSE